LKILIQKSARNNAATTMYKFKIDKRLYKTILHINRQLRGTNELVVRFVVVVRQ
jgi:hypothetical protein